MDPPGARSQLGGGTLARTRPAAGVLVSAAFPGTRRLLEKEGYEVLTVDNSELLKAESGVTCSSIIFESDAPDLP